MARSFSGFAPQNECVMEQWHALEADQREFAPYLDLLAEEEAEGAGNDENDVVIIPE